LQISLVMIAPYRQSRAALRDLQARATTLGTDIDVRA
jgi:hypothetical protein